ncbi:MAG: methyltransferase domain-containing protein [bacterium]
MTDVDRAEFWETQYRQGTAAWDLGGPTPSFVHLLAGPDAPAPGRMVVPGCGRGYDAVLFARAGFDVTGVDHAPSAVRAARALAAAEGAACTFLQADLFSLPGRFPAVFDYALEYTCFCAISPARRGEYVEVLAGVLRPGGEVLALFFPVLPPGYPPEGPPFAVSEEEIRALFGGLFEIIRLAPAPHSITPRRGRELLGRLRRR